MIEHGSTRKIVRAVREDQARDSIGDNRVDEVFKIGRVVRVMFDVVVDRELDACGLFEFDRGMRERFPIKRPESGVERTVREYECETIAVGEPIRDEDALPMFCTDETVAVELVDGALHGHAADVEFVDNLLHGGELLARLPLAARDPGAEMPEHVFEKVEALEEYQGTPRKTDIGELTMEARKFLRELSNPEASVVDMAKATQVAVRDLAAQVGHVLRQFGNGPGHVFNLGHGVSQFTPPEHVGALVEAVHSLSRSYHRPLRG